MQTERIRQTLSGPIRIEDVEKFQSQGWKPRAIEWERELPAIPTPPAHEVEGPPFGLRVADDCSTLEDDPGEKEILLTMMELIIQDGPYSFIAQQLNRKGYVTRQGTKWSPVAVFEMLPRLIEAGPKIFSTEEWQRRRQQSQQQRPQLPI
ncbi:MAG: recombinase family protein [Terriglobales bacterium]